MAAQTEQAAVLRGSCHCGAMHWSFEGDPGSATSCNCTICRRHGALWIYDWEGERVTATGGSGNVYIWGHASLGFHFCPTCGCVAFWRSLRPDAAGRLRMAVNVRLAEPETVAHLQIDHFDGLVAFDDLPRDGRTVHDMWF